MTYLQCEELGRLGSSADGGRDPATATSGMIQFCSGSFVDLLPFVVDNLTVCMKYNTPEDEVVARCGLLTFDM